MVGLLSLESCCGRPKMRNSVLEGLRDWKLDQFNSCFGRYRIVELIVFHANITSLNLKHVQLCPFLAQLVLDFDFIILCEVWTINISIYCKILPCYDFYYDIPLILQLEVLVFLLRAHLVQCELLQYKLLNTLYNRRNLQAFKSTNRRVQTYYPCFVADDIIIDLTKCSVNIKLLSMLICCS